MCLNLYSLYILLYLFESCWESRRVPANLFLWTAAHHHVPTHHALFIILPTTLQTSINICKDNSAFSHDMIKAFYFHHAISIKHYQIEPLYPENSSSSRSGCIAIVGEFMWIGCIIGVMQPNRLVSGALYLLLQGTE